MDKDLFRISLGHTRLKLKKQKHFDSKYTSYTSDV